MTAQVTEDEWTPLDGALPQTVQNDIVYVIPTRAPVHDDEGDRIPRYPDHMRYFPKEVRNAESPIPVEFSIPSGSRKFISEYSIDPDVWALALAVMTMSNDWLIYVTQTFIEMRARAQGWTAEQVAELPLKVSIVETSTSRTVEIEGSGSDVIEAVRVLNRKNGAGKSVDKNR